MNPPGAIIGCPTRPLTPAPVGDPPAGLVDAARQYTGFRLQIGSCGATTVAASWVVELVASGRGVGGGDIHATVVLAHSPDGWRAFGHN